MDFIKILGGIALGATGAALFDALRSDKKIGPLGQGVVTGGFGGGAGGFGGGPAGPGGGGPGVIMGPPPGGGGAGMGPGLVDFMPSGKGAGDVGPTVSVTTDPWFWPLNVNWLFPQPPRSLVCVEGKTEDDEKIVVCQESYQVQPLFGERPQGYAWGPSARWL